MSELDEIATKAECLKVAMRQTKDGYVMSLVIHPNDMPEDLLRDPVGQRYLAVFVRVDETEEPVPSQDVLAGEAAVKQAGALCSDPRFQGWLVSKGMADEADEDSASVAVRKHCGVTSRKELKTNKKAFKTFKSLVDEFQYELRNSLA